MVCAGGCVGAAGLAPGMSDYSAHCLQYPVADLRKLLFAGFCGVWSNLGVGV